MAQSSAPGWSELTGWRHRLLLWRCQWEPAQQSPGVLLWLLFLYDTRRRPAPLLPLPCPRCPHCLWPLWPPPLGSSCGFGSPGQRSSAWFRRPCSCSWARGCRCRCRTVDTCGCPAGWPCPGSRGSRGSWMASFCVLFVWLSGLSGWSAGWKMKPPRSRALSRQLPFWHLSWFSSIENLRKGKKLNGLRRWQKI